MLFKQNLGPRQRVARIVGGMLMIGCGFLPLHASPVGIVFAVVGGVSLLTGIVRYCPVCKLDNKGAGGR